MSSTIFFKIELTKIKRWLGCIFYELITLKLAFNEKRRIQLFDQIIGCEYEAISKSNENYDLFNKIIKE